MELFTEDNLKKLAEQRGTSVSIYMPTFRAGADLQQNPIRYKNLIGEAEEQLVSLGYRPTDAADFLDPARRILQNGAFWKNMSDGLAVFVSGDILETYRLPYSFNQMAVGGYQFHLKPILGMLSGNTRFYVLVLSMNGPRLYEGSRFSLNRIQSDLLPGSLVDTLGFDNAEKQVQFASKPAITGDNPTTVFGYGRQTDKTKVNLLNYFHRVDDAVSKILANSYAPLITAGLEYHNPIYREANSYPYLIRESIQSNLEEASETDIHSHAWPVILPHLQETEDKAFSYFEQLRGEHSPVVTEDLKTIVQGALHGRIETLFIADGQTHRWGKFDAENQALILHEGKKPGDEDLLENAAINTYFKKGTVYVLKPEQIPASSEAAAILRY